MSAEALTRRTFLKSTGALAGTGWLRLSASTLAGLAQAACSARDEGTAFTVLADDEAAEFAAIAARIIPTTETPGATEAGVIHFFDQAFAADMAGALDFAREGLTELHNSLPDLRFAELDRTRQDAALEAIENDAFFELMRVLTIFGFFAMENYGGNRDQVGWDLISFDGHHGAWQYPFGFYDGQVHRGEDDGG